MEEGVLARLLDALEKTLPLSKSPILAELVEASREPIEEQWKYPFHLVRYAAIEIIKSGIFVEDRLKGKKIASIPPKLKTYPINDPEELVWLIALPLGKDIEEERSQEVFAFLKRGVNRCFHQLMTDMNNLSEFIEPYAKTRTKEKIDKIQAELDSLRDDLLVNLPKGSFRLEDPIDYMINVLERHVPEAPGETIAKRVADILKIANIGDVRYQTVLQRMTRRKQENA